MGSNPTPTAKVRSTCADTESGAQTLRAFFIWIIRNRWNPEACEEVSITEDPNSLDGCDFAEFPNDPDLDGFDRDDRKFVAVARGYR